MSIRSKIVKMLGYKLMDGGKPTRPIPSSTKTGKIESVANSNDFQFESNLGLFLEKGFDAFSAEGDRQGYDDPTTVNWNKQVQLLKVQLDNNISRELFIKNNRYTKLTTTLEATDNIVTDMVDFKLRLKGIENEIEYLKEQRELATAEQGWYLMLHEALHDGFQDGSKKKLGELTANL